ncbi:PREDICTED: golgin subfamily A member 7-like [Amphimedon queenslandica]|uniref:Ras modification protein ERF4 n=1 Tax=Amphimedon queenslandica TaxID=400682 RepID=A0A1X7VL17_AMPQE|nr:PREDICTED: golgin subfamily A member 7-like [Amphimedon queenslandica]|eukprot:XP_003383906.1 PREDICTED: golgin subfamily A member 7-like [Amphimedon queenslandica]
MERSGPFSKKIFIQRDYSYGTAVRFSSEFPQELRGKIGEREFQETIDEINVIFEEAEAYNCQRYGEGCLACLTGYTIHFCFKTHYQKCTERAARYIQERNYHIFERHGVLMGDPMDRGLRCIEVNITYDGDQ